LSLGLALEEVTDEHLEGITVPVGVVPGGADVEEGIRVLRHTSLSF